MGLIHRSSAAWHSQGMPLALVFCRTEGAELSLSLFFLVSSGCNYPQLCVSLTLGFCPEADRLLKGVAGGQQLPENLSFWKWVEVRHCGFKGSK